MVDSAIKDANIQTQTQGTYMPTLTRTQIQDMFIQICKDSGYGLKFIDAAIILAKVIKVSPLEIWMAFSSMSVMAEIAAGEHPACKRAK